jgi:hypothetical protein
MAFECLLILVMTVELVVVILSVIEGSREYSEWSGEMAGPATAMFTFAETSSSLQQNTPSATGTSDDRRHLFFW